MATAAAGAIKPGDIPPLVPGERVDGLTYINQLPATVGVVDRNGNHVGEVFRSDLDSNSVVNVYKNGEHVGYFGPNGFYGLDEVSPVFKGKETWVEEWVDGSDEPTWKYRKDE